MATYTINHMISNALESWLVSQPNFVSFKREDNGNRIVLVYTHTAQQAKDFKRALGKRMGLDDDNVNLEEIKYFVKGLVQILINKGTITLQDVQNQFPELFD